MRRMQLLNCTEKRVIWNFTTKEEMTKSNELRDRTYKEHSGRFLSMEFSDEGVLKSTGS